MNDTSWTLLQHLREYLSQTGWLAALQLVIFVTVIHLVLYRSLRVVGLVGRRLEKSELVGNQRLEGVTRLCLGLGLLLTFSGMYSYIGSGADGNGSLLLALGSSAIGYSAWTICALAPVIDSFRCTQAETAPADNEPRSPHALETEAGRLRSPIGIEQSELPVTFSGPAPTRQYCSSHGSYDGAATPSAPSPSAGKELHPVTAFPSESVPLEAGPAPNDLHEFNHDIMEREEDEQEPIADFGSGRGHLGGDVHHSPPSSTDDLGSLDGYQFTGPATASDVGRSDPDLDEGWAMRYLAGADPTADPPADRRPPEENGRRNQHPFGD